MSSCPAPWGHTWPLTRGRSAQGQPPCNIRSRRASSLSPHHTVLGTQKGRLALDSEDPAQTSLDLPGLAPQVDGRGMLCLPEGQGQG